MAPLNEAPKSPKRKSRSSISINLHLKGIGCAILLISVLHMMIAIKRTSLSSASLMLIDGSPNGMYSLTLSWKQDDGRKAGNDNEIVISFPEGIKSNLRPLLSDHDPTEARLEMEAEQKVEQKAEEVMSVTADAEEELPANIVNNLDVPNKPKQSTEKRVSGRTAEAQTPINTKKGSSKELEKIERKEEFVRHDNVVIATKIHGEHQWGLLEQSMCLLHHAYNNKVLYDVVAFATEAVSQEKIDSLKELLGPAKFSLVVDNKGLHEEIADLPPAKYDAFLKRCNITSSTNLTWFSNCGGDRLAYNWQAEFRSTRIWHHPALTEYKTMLWMDSDGFATKPWEKDPVHYFIENDGVIMFDHFPQAKSSQSIQPRVGAGFNSTICKLELSGETGNLVPKLGQVGKCHDRGIPNIHGFFHITNMEFYRSKPVQKGLETLLDDCFLCRFPDDQLAVTAPAAILAPERSWEMRGKGFHLDVFHNYLLDGIDQAKPAGFLKYWKQVGKNTLPSAANICPVTAAN